MNLRNVFSFCGLFLLFGNEPANSTLASIMTDEQDFCGYSEVGEELCASYCFKSISQPMAHIIELKEQIKATAQGNINKDNQIMELIKRLLEINDWKDQVKANNKQIEYLSETIGMFVKSLRQENQISKIEKNISNTIDNQKAAIENKKFEATNDEEKYSLKLKQMEKSLIECKAKMPIKYSGKTNKKLYKSSKCISINNGDKSILIACGGFLKQRTVQKPLQPKLANRDGIHEKLQQVEKELNECLKKIPKSSCKGLSTGIHLVTIPGVGSYRVLCNADIAGGGWMVIQNRFNGTENYPKNWTDFRNNFGSLEGKFIMGLDLLHQITNSATYELYIKIGFLGGSEQFVSYDNFRIGSEDTKYELQSLGNIKGNVTNKFRLNLNQKFSTIDQDNDHDLEEHCAKLFDSTWWYDVCSGHNKNKNFQHYERRLGMRRTGSYFLNSFQMLIRPISKLV